MRIECFIVINTCLVLLSVVMVSCLKKLSPALDRYTDTYEKYLCNFGQNYLYSYKAARRRLYWLIADVCVLLISLGGFFALDIVLIISYFNS